MPDLGLTKGLSKAIRSGSKGAKVVRPEEAELLLREPVDITKPRVEPSLQPATPAGTPGPTVADQMPPFKPDDPTVDLPPPQEPGDITEEAGRLSRAKLADYDLEATSQPNFDTIRTTDDVKAVIADFSAKNAGKIDETRRGVITNQQLQSLADDLGLDGTMVRRVMERESGGALNAETILGARQMLNSSAQRISDLAKKITAGQATDLERIQFRRQLQFHGDFQNQFMGARAESGRALNAFSIPAGVNEAQIARLKDAVESLVGDTDDIAKVLSEVNNPAGISKFARKYNQSRTGDVLSELYVNSILSGPKTAIVNTMGNALFQGMNIAETAVAGWLGKVLPGADHVRTGEAMAQIHGTLSAVGDGLRLASKAFKTGRTIDDIVKFQTPVRRAISAEKLLPAAARDTMLGRFVDGLGTFIRLPTERLMAPVDEFFKTLAYRADLERQALVHVQDQIASGAATRADAGRLAQDFLENTPTKSAEAASEYARYAAFQNQLGDAGKAWERALRSHPALTILAPFIRTPVNIFKAGLFERSPLAVFSRKFREDVKAGGRRRDMALARVGMGSATAAYAAYEAMQGRLTGGGPQDDAQRQLLEAQGWRPYSIRWTDDEGNVQYTSYARLEPLAFVLGAVADIVEINSYLNSDVETMADEDSETWQAAAAIIAGIANNTMSKTFTKGLADFSELMSDPQRYAKQWAGNMATAFVPYSSFRRQINQIQDPYMREAWTLMDKLKTSSGIPGYSQEAPPRRDVYGRPREYAAGNILGPMSPIPSSEEGFDPVNDEIVRVMQATQDVPISMPRKRIEGMRLTADEYDDLVRLSRVEPVFGGKRTFREELERVMDSTVYQTATDVMRAELLKMVQSNADDIAAAKLEEENTSFADRIAVYRSKEDQLRFGQ